MCSSSSTEITVNFLVLCICSVIVEATGSEDTIPTWVIIVIVLLVILIIVGVVVILMRRRYLNMKKRENETKYATYSKYTRRSTTTLNEKASDATNDKRKPENKKRLDVKVGVTEEKEPLLPVVPMTNWPNQSKTKYKERYFILKEIR